jgi:hypothetical protein
LIVELVGTFKLPIETLIGIKGILASKKLLILESTVVGHKKYPMLMVQ